jgi:hypothetical protein
MELKMRPQPTYGSDVPYQNPEAHQSAQETQTKSIDIPANSTTWKVSCAIPIIGTISRVVSRAALQNSSRDDHVPNDRLIKVEKGYHIADTVRHLLSAGSLSVISLTIHSSEGMHTLLTVGIMVYGAVEAMDSLVQTGVYDN